MKNLLLPVCVSIILFGCGSQEAPAPVPTTETPAKAQPEPVTTAQTSAPTKAENKAKSVMESPEITAVRATPATDNTMSNATDSDMLSRQDALTLARKSGCLACHTIEKKQVGPAWKDVAAFYTGKPDSQLRLIEKVKKGGKGNWTKVTGGTPMPPYSPRVSDHNIQRLVRFILSLDQ